MMAYLRIALSAVLAILLATIALANRDFVSVQLLPGTIGNLIGFNFGLGCRCSSCWGWQSGWPYAGAGLEWLREHSYPPVQRPRACAAVFAALESDLEKFEKAAPSVAQKDDVLAVLEAK